MSRLLRRKRASGFTLLELMIAVSILAGGLTWLIVGISRNIKAENHAKLMTAATFLAREKMVDLEDQLYDKGFGEFDKESNGTFDDKGFARFSWRAIVDKVELPSVEQLQTVLTGAQQSVQQAAGGNATGSSDTSSGSPLGGLLGGLGGGGGAGGSSGVAGIMGAGAGMIGSQFGIIKDVLEQAIRRVTIKVQWTEGRTPQEVELVAYYSDVRRVDQAIQIGSGAAGGAPGTPPPGGGGGSSGTVH